MDGTCAGAPEFSSATRRRSYPIFTAGGLNWRVINLELWARSGAVDWAKTIVAKYPDLNVIFLTHAHLNGDGSIQHNNGGYLQHLTGPLA